MQKKTLTLLITAACLTQAYAQDALAPITVSASRETVTLQNTATKSTVVGKNKIEEKQAQTLGDVLQHIPSTTSINALSRSGEGDVVIRGISGKGRVNIAVDGLPIAESFDFGPWQKVGREYFDTSNMQTVEVQPGANNKMPNYLGGTVNITTSNPNEIIKDDKRFGGSVFSEYTSKDNSKRIGGTGAFKTERGLSGLLSYTYTDQHELKNNHKDKKDAPTPERVKKHSINGKVVYQANENNTFSFNGSYFQLNDELKNKSKKDTQNRKALSITHDFSLESPVANSGYWKAYSQQSESKQKTFLSFPGAKLDFNNQYKVRDLGLELEFNKIFGDGQSVEHDLTYGINYKNTHSSMVQKGHHKYGPKEFDSVSKYSPDGTANNLNIFVQDKIFFADSGVSLIPGLTYSYNSLTSKKNDQEFIKGLKKYTFTGNPELKDYSTHRILPKLGAIYDINETQSIYANYSTGFRSPSYSETNFRFINTRGTPPYSVVGNPNLKSESSHNFELGYKVNGDHWSSTLTGFYNHYNNYIYLDTSSARAREIKNGFNQFRYDNISSANIYGVEWSSDWKAFEGLTVQTTLVYNKGENKDTNKPINNINPLNGLVSVNYDAPEKRWGVGATLTASAAKSAKDINSAGSVRNQISPSAGYGVVDLTGYYRPIDDLTIRAGVYNVFDKQYIPWTKAQTLSTSDRDGENEPGRWFGASMKYEF